MSDPWGAHKAALAGAIDALARVQEYISVSTEQCDVAMGAILACAGSTEVDSGQNALALTGAAKEKLDEAFRQITAAVEEMERYGRGF